MKKRILTVLLAVCLVFALGTVSALADDPVAKIGDTPYTDLSEAFNAVQDGKTIELLKDVTLTSDINVRQNESDRVTYTLDLGSHTLTSKENTTALRLYNSNITITNGTIDLNDTDANVNTCAIWCYKDVNLTIADSATINADGDSYCIGVRNEAEDVTVNVNGALTGGCGLTINGQIKSDKNIDVVINGKIDVSYLGLYLAGVGETTVNSSAYIKGDTGIEIRAGELTVNGGTIVGGDNYTSAANSNGSTVSGAGIAVSQHTTNQNIDVTINGGNISGAVALDQEELQSGNNAEQVNISVSGGNFKATSTEREAIETHSEETVTVTGGTFLKSDNTKSNVGKYLAPGLDIDEDGDVVVGDDAVAQVGDTVYTDLQAAINVAPVGGTVTLLKDIHPVVPDGATAGQSGAITINKNITIDGKNLQIIADDGSFTTTSNTGNFHVINVTGGNVTIKNLNIDGDDSARSGINVWGNGSANPTVTIEDTDIKDCTTYAVTIGSATVTADGLRTSGGGWGGVNVDTKNGDSSFTMESGTLADNYSVIVGEDADHDSDVNLEGGNYSKIQVKVSNTDIDISGGSYEGIEVIDGVTITDQISITGGTFEERQPNTYVDTDYVAYNRTTGYTYTDSLSTAMNAAGQNGYVDYVAGNGWDVTLYYDKDVQTEIEVPKDYTFRLPGGTFEGKQIEGWKYGSEVFEPGDTDKITSDRTYYVILRNGQYNIVIDDDIKHGDVSTDVSSADKGATVYIYVDPDIGYVLDDLDVCYGYRNQYSVNVKFVRTGVYSFIMPGYNVYITATFRYESLPFTDVNRSQWFYDEVYYVYTNGMMEGDSATTFNPDGRMTRAMFWAVLGRIDGATITGNDWAEEARAWAMREGVSDGTNPNDYVTREQMVTMLWRYAGEKNGSASLIRYTDADKISSYAVEAMRWAIGNGIIEGMTSTTLEPQGTATRAQCAAIFMRFDQM